MKSRILILGGPKAGKTTEATALAEKLGVPVEHFDDLIDEHDWSEASDIIAKSLDEPGPWVKEGVAGVRGLRKWLRQNPGKVPPFEIKVMKKTHKELTLRQRMMHNQHMKILEECMKEIEKRKAK